jgi:hypothetical protein
LSATVTYNKDQWIESFKGRLQIVRPHLTGRVLDTIGNAAWHSRGTQGEDPIKAANAASTELDAQAKKRQLR